MGWDQSIPPVLPPKFLDEQPDYDGVDDQTNHFPPTALFTVIAALYLINFLVGLDRTIVATSIPNISDDFNSLGDIGWYGSSYLITGGAFQLLFGRIYTFYSPKWVFLSAIILFATGSGLCGAAPSSVIFIVGRAVAGLGSAGIFSGAVVIVAHCVPLHKRPLYGGLVATAFGLSSIMGPLLGGGFTQKVSWRWCFYLNLPIAAVVMLVIFFLFDLPRSDTSKSNISIQQKVAHLDPLGTLCFLPSIVCLLLALQWGGTVYPWGNGQVFVLLVIFGILMSCFVAIQVWQKTNATVPPRMIKQRSIASGIWFSLVHSGSMILIVYFLQIWFQAIKDVGAVKSGIMSFPLILGGLVGTVIAGGIVTTTGYYTPFMIMGPAMMSIGAGLITTFTPNTGRNEWIGYQFLFGFGFGSSVQQPIMAVQTVLPMEDVPTGVCLMLFAQFLGSAIFISVGQNVFVNRLASSLASVANLDVSRIIATGATDLRGIVHDPASLHRVFAIYNDSLIDVFRVALGLACVSVVAGLTMEWKSVKQKPT